MENASKAIIIAGSVLTGIIVLSLLVAFFNNVRNLQQTKAETESIAKDAEFNKKFDAYNRDVYGSELLSIAKFIEDYNEREGGDNKAYQKIELEVKVNEDLDANLLKKGTYNVDSLNQAVKKIEDQLVTTGTPNTTIANHVFYGTGSKQRRTYQLATMRTKEIKDFLGIKDTENIPTDMQKYINDYNTYKAILIQIKSKVYKCTGFEYDQHNGRVTKMKYEL